MPLPFFSSQNHYAPHPSAAFEGYYAKFRLPSGASIALIVSLVPGADGGGGAGSRGNDVGDGRKDGSSEESTDDLSKAGSETASSKRESDPPYLVSFTYVNQASTKWFQRELKPRAMRTTGYSEDDHASLSSESSQDIEPASEDSDRSEEPIHDSSGFTISWDDGAFSWSGPTSDIVRWDLRYPDLYFSARTTGRIHHGSNTGQDYNGDGSPPLMKPRTPWKPTDTGSTPAGWLANLPLPIQWHVHSLDSTCTFTLHISPSDDDSIKFSPPLIDRQGQAHVHTEKNWAASFPASYIWVQGRNHDRNTGICIAGGSLIRGVQAYLIGHQLLSSSPNGPHVDTLTFAPPTSTSILGLSLGLHSDIAYTDRNLTIDVRGWFRRLAVTASAPEGTFFTLSAPLVNGHREGYTVQSFAARIAVKRYERRWVGLGGSWGRSWFAGDGLGAGWGWEWVESGEEVYDGGSLEFGGEFYKRHME